MVRCEVVSEKQGVDLKPSIIDGDMIADDAAAFLALGSHGNTHERGPYRVAQDIHGGPRQVWGRGSSCPGILLQDVSDGPPGEQNGHKQARGL